MSKMDLLDKLRMRLWLENRRLYGTGGINGKSVNDFNLQDIRKIEIDPDVVIPEHYKRVLVENENERKAAFRKLLKEHGVKMPPNYNPDLFTYFLSVLRARSPYTIEGTKKALAKRKAARDKRAAKRRAARERERNRGNVANGGANEEEREDNEEEDENAVQEEQPPPARARASALSQRRKTRKTRKTRTSSATSPASRRYYFRERNN